MSLLKKKYKWILERLNDNEKIRDMLIKSQEV